MAKNNDLHLWLDDDDYLYVCRTAREEMRSKNAVVTRLIRRARAEELEMDDETERAELGHVCPRVSRL